MCVGSDCFFSSDCGKVHEQRTVISPRFVLFLGTVQHERVTTLFHGTTKRGTLEALCCGFSFEDNRRFFTWLVQLGSVSRPHSAMAPPYAYDTPYSLRQKPRQVGMMHAARYTLMGGRSGAAIAAVLRTFFPLRMVGVLGMFLESTLAPDGKNGLLVQAEAFDKATLWVLRTWKAAADEKYCNTIQEIRKKLPKDAAGPFIFLRDSQQHKVFSFSVGNFFLTKLDQERFRFLRTAVCQYRQ